MKKYDWIIVGAGLYGAVFAREMTDRGRKVLVLEKRSLAGGNACTEEIAGIRVHKYGAHIFHTSDREVWEYVNRFAVFNRYTNSPVANYRGEIYSLPFNMYTFNRMWGVVTPKEAEERIREQREAFLAECRRQGGRLHQNKAGESREEFVPRNLEEQAVSLVGRDLYEKLVKGYTEKQWGRKCTELPAFIIRRLPVRFTYDNNYFDALYQGIPVGGYTAMAERMLSGAEVCYETDYLEEKEKFDSMAERVLYTGPVDAYCGYALGPLEYRTLHFETEVLPQENFQGNAVVNYTDAETPWTRIIEHKYFEFGKDEHGNRIPRTVISREYSAEWKPGEEPYYPVNDERNSRLYEQYRKLAEKDGKVRFGGRLGEYRYYDMDQAVRAALEAARESV